MNLHYANSFVVYPQHANCHQPLIFGGSFYGQLDLAAATATKRLLYESRFCEAAVTHKSNVTYHKPCYVGDLIFIEAQIVSLGKKSIVIEVKAFREKKEDRQLVAEAKFVFVSITNADDMDSKPEFLPYHDHGLTMDQ